MELFLTLGGYRGSGVGGQLGLVRGFREWLAVSLFGKSEVWTAGGWLKFGKRVLKKLTGKSRIHGDAAMHGPTA